MITKKQQTNRKETGQRIREARKYWGFTQTQLAQYLQISQGQIAKIENGHRPINTTLITDLCKLFNCSENWLTQGVGTHDMKRLHLCYIEN